jgi:DNA polymerase-3 subunit delta'
MTLPWLGDAMTALQAAYRADRMPHALLIHEAPGSGGDWLASWICRLVLCIHRERSPCEHCAGCQRVNAGQHPDLMYIRPLEDSRQIRIEQVRELAQELALTSHQGGYKVGLLAPADVLNRFAANALLKTLEEPPQRTVLILVVTQPSRLPATVLSRCQRLRVRAPTRAEAVAWLESTRAKNEAREQSDWNAVLDILGEAPMMAAELDAATVVQVGNDVWRGLRESAAGTLDPVATAERWARTDLPLRLRCFETWLTERIREQIGNGAFLTEVGAVPYLQPTDTVLNIRALFGLLDEVGDLKSALESPINRGLALENLLRRLSTRGQHNALSGAR